MRTRSQTTRGLTLLELLVGIALAVVIVLAASNLLISSSRGASDLQGRNELLEESQIAQNYLAGRVREAAYVFPPGSSVTLGKTGETTKRPDTGGQTWEVGNPAAPILALVTPPRVAGADCKPSDKKTSGCWTFYAYYPVKRKTFVAGVSNSNDPGDDPQNEDRWVLAEYRDNYEMPPANVASLTPETGRSGQLLLDYVQPPVLAPSGTPPLFEIEDRAPETAAQEPGSIRVTLNFALSRVVGGRVVNVPPRNADTPPDEAVQTIEVTPRNLGRLAP